MVGNDFVRCYNLFQILREGSEKMEINYDFCHKSGWGYTGKSLKKPFKICSPRSTFSSSSAFNFRWALHPKKIQNNTKRYSRYLQRKSTFKKYFFSKSLFWSYTFKLWFVENLIKGRLLSLKLIIKGKLF